MMNCGISIPSNTSQQLGWTTTNNNLDECQKHYAEWKKSVTKQRNEHQMISSIRNSKPAQIISSGRNSNSDCLWWEGRAACNREQEKIQSGGKLPYLNLGDGYTHVCIVKTHQVTHLRTVRDSRLNYSLSIVSIKKIKKSTI